MTKKIDELLHTQKGFFIMAFVREHTHTHTHTIPVSGWGENQPVRVAGVCRTSVDLQARQPLNLF
jgi:hypothetical protein